MVNVQILCLPIIWSELNLTGLAVHLIALKKLRFMTWLPVDEQKVTGKRDIVQIMRAHARGTPPRNLLWLPDSFQ